MNYQTGLFSVRSVNQYRRREIFAYLGLRYYLESTAARTDIWAENVAVNMLRRRNPSTLYRVNHFKKFSDSGAVLHRSLYVPDPCEALSEAVLLEECSQHPVAFQNPACVFSYYLSGKGDNTGVFRNYMPGLQKRHRGIADACSAIQDGLVQYTDIKEFYTSIPLEVARKSWNQYADIASLDTRYRDIADALIRSQESVLGNEKKTLLIGPMFSHLLANLVLRDLDQMMMNDLPVKCFRYVDDITLVGQSEHVAKSLGKIETFLNAELGLKLHEADADKCITVPSLEWLKGKNDFADEDSNVSWKCFIGSLKRYLLFHPEERWNLYDALRNEDFRIPIKDYSGMVVEKGYIDRVKALAWLGWFNDKSKEVTVSSLVRDAAILKKRYEEEILSYADEAFVSEGYAKKRLIPKLRYRAGRLVYLSSTATLTSIAEFLKEIKELNLHTEVMKTVSTGALDEILHLGTNAAQAAAQPLRAAGKECTLRKRSLSDCEEQSLAVLILNGVNVEKYLSEEVSEALRFATHGADRLLLKSEEGFIRHLACLHGISKSPRHSELLEAAFNEDENLVFDAVDGLHQSESI